MNYLRKTVYRLYTVVIIIAVILLTVASPAKADGGIVLSDPELWAQLEEGQQTAVVTLNDNNTASVDLFVSMLDNSGRSHEIVFFVPLGKEPSDFRVVEKTSLDFDRQLTEKLDSVIRKDAEDRMNIRLAMSSASIVINGGWMLAAWFPTLLFGCAYHEGDGPEASYETESSKIDIYGLDDDTDLEALMDTAGLDSSVKSTLSRLTGQRIAVVTLQTQLPVSGGDNGYRIQGQPGIHMSWTTALISQSATAVYSYPLGTGSAWARPIGLTRVYVVSPSGMDFRVQYPKLGDEHSGFDRSFFISPRAEISRYYDTSAYAVDEAAGNIGYVWRGIYTQSNSAEDIVITIGKSAGFMNSIKRTLTGLGVIPNFITGILITLIIWVTAWRYLMPLMLGIEYRWSDSRLWRDSLVYPGINVIFILAAAFVGVLFSMFAGYMTILSAFFIILILLPVAFGIPGLIYLVTRHRYRMDVNRCKPVIAYIVVILVSNIAYLALGYGYALLIGVI